MKNKKILTIISLICFLLGVVIIVFALTKKDSNTRLEIEFSNLVTTDNTFTIDYKNISNKDIENKKIILFLENNDKKLIMTVEVDIDSLKINETKTYEYSQDSPFKEIPKYYYYKDYDSKIEIIENINLDTKLTNILKENAKIVTENKFQLDTFTDTKLTVVDLERELNKEITIFHDKSYGCSLTNSYVLVTKQNNNYNYETYIECDIFKEE